MTSGAASPDSANVATGLLASSGPLQPSVRHRSRWAARGRHYLALLALMAPMLVGMILFIYYPQYSTIKYSFYKWDGGALFEEYRGLENYRRAFTGDTLFWPTFNLVLVLLATNIIKMGPSIFTAIVIHRLKSERWQYVYRVLFVIPMVIPALVGLLIWKSFYDPLIGPLNKFLRATGLMSVLAWLDVHMPLLSSKLMPFVEHLVEPLFSGVWGMLMVGVLLMSAAGGVGAVRRSWLYWAIIVALCAALMGVGPAHEAALGTTSSSTPHAVLRFVVWTAGAIGAGELVSRRFGASGRGALRWIGGAVVGLACLLIVGATLWTSPVGQFDLGTPGWLSNSKLIVPSLVLWGFPWVGTVGVLLYLAGLQNIGQEIYEAAEIDGVGSFGKLFYIELPLILTQVRINLIFLTIGTLTDYGLFLLLLGSDGGPGGVGMVPGLYMYRSAFVDGEFGYACALGIVLAAIILFITVFYQKYVTVEK